MSSNVTLVTACDKNYLWGAFLLAASAARSIPNVPMHVVQTGFSGEDITFFTQFPLVSVLPLAADDPRNVANRKAEALLTAESEYIGWLDADCMIVGDIEPMLVPQNGEFQIRLRGEAENAQVWSNHYASGELHRGVPAAVLAQWRDDVGQLTSPTHNTACVTNAFILHRRHLDFIRQWKCQIAKVIAPANTGVVDRRSRPYFMIDESVLSSLLAFSAIAPPVAPYQLDRVDQAHVAHFGVNPKPWKRWRKQFWRYHAPVMDLIDWLHANGHAVPPIPWSLRRSSTPLAWALAQADAPYAAIRTFGGDLLRRWS
jgi:hypothetical protein